MNIFAFGFGQVSKYFIKKLAKEKNNFELNISSRKDSHSGLFEGIKFNSYQFDVKKIDNKIFEAILKADYILISIPPVNEQDIVIKNFKEIIKKTKTKWITYLSATSVYGNHNGDWVNEKSKTKPTTINGVNRLKAEDQWLEFSKKYNLPLQIFRLSGIYSNQNNILKRLLAGQTKIVKKENHFFSRIHIEDISNILIKSLKKFKRNEIFNISDDKPAPQIDVVNYGSKLLKVVSPEPIKLDNLEDGMLKDFYRDSKKVDNKKMKEFFNYKLIYPTYKEGLDRIFNNII